MLDGAWRVGGGHGALALIVDDEPDIRELLGHALQRSGYRTLLAATGTEALDLAATHAPDVIVLDVVLPDLLGTEVCRLLKTQPATQQTPVVMLSARVAEADRIQGLELGADDYVSKPFSMRELLLRLDVARRRHVPIDAAAAVQRALRIGPLEIDRAAMLARLEGQALQLTNVELRLLTYLAEHEGRACRRDELLVNVWSCAPESPTRTLETHMKRLRAKLGPFGANIVTIRSVGYRLSVDRTS
jgi:two-component system phosphate regulon response regulator PhoB